MVVCGLMLSSGDKSVWPDPANPYCMFAVAGHRGNCLSSPSCREGEKGAARGAKSGMSGRKEGKKIM